MSYADDMRYVDRKKSERLAARESRKKKPAADTTATDPGPATTGGQK